MEKTGGFLISRGLPGLQPHPGYAQIKRERGYVFSSTSDTQLLYRGKYIMQ